eukprot:1886900-Amphidinium_carterae.3
MFQIGKLINVAETQQPSVLFLVGYMAQLLGVPRQGLKTEVLESWRIRTLHLQYSFVHLRFVPTFIFNRTFRPEGRKVAATPRLVAFLRMEAASLTAFLAKHDGNIVRWATADASPQGGYKWLNLGLALMEIVQYESSCKKGKMQRYATNVHESTSMEFIPASCQFLIPANSPGFVLCSVCWHVQTHPDT